jgi:secreted Zn-dependent insulinase-like peptidase
MVKSSQKVSQLPPTFCLTAQYPVENEFKTYVQEHGGTRKAETYFAYSRYQFDVTSDALEQGFDRKAD